MKTLGRLGVVLLFTVFSSLPARAAFIPTELIVFGDSLSTNSIHVSSIPDPSVVSYANRVADNLGITGTNYAQAGATSAHMLSNLENLYLAGGAPIDAGAVHIINIGLNDGWWGVDLDQGILDTTILNISSMVQQLTDAGAQNIYLADYMNRGRNAGIHKIAQDNGLDFDLLSARIGAVAIDASQQVLNAALAINSDVLSLGLGDFIEEVEADPAEWGFDQDKFFNCYYGLNPTFLCNEDPVSGHHGTSPDDTQLFYLDGGHLTFAANDAVGNFITERIEEDAYGQVPVPATLWLFASGVLLVLRRQRG